MRGLKQQRMWFSFMVHVHHILAGGNLRIILTHRSMLREAHLCAFISSEPEKENMVDHILVLKLLLGSNKHTLHLHLIEQVMRLDFTSRG